MKLISLSKQAYMSWTFRSSHSFIFCERIKSRMYVVSSNWMEQLNREAWIAAILDVSKFQYSLKKTTAREKKTVAKMRNSRLRHGQYSGNGAVIKTIIERNNNNNNFRAGRDRWMRQQQQQNKFYAFINLVHTLISHRTDDEADGSVFKSVQLNLIIGTHHIHTRMAGAATHTHKWRQYDMISIVSSVPRMFKIFIIFRCSIT